ncbi:hypothetical protein H5410_062237 [Solanum commersonii]|uniref:Uncharacterized protein n=1 Tax=Solanum commersonii TaxID=4109 RepID=A0A9J5WAY3_SOLCO|nr:hypothetical protein H5410_062237 [Solanum commersonii]
MDAVLIANEAIDSRNKQKKPGSLEVLLPDIYNLLLFQQSTITELWSPKGWNFIFKRQLNDSEIMRVADFVNIVDIFNDCRHVRMFCGRHEMTVECSKLTKPTR